MLIQQIGLVEGEAGFPSLTSTIRGSIFALIVPPVDPSAPVIDPDAPVEGAPEGATESPEGDAAAEGDQVSMAAGGTR